MATETYKPFIDRVIQRYEGGYGWDRKDPGGPTKYGVTCFDLAEARGQKMTSMSAWAPIVQAMQLAEAEAIYVKKYVSAVRFYDLPRGVDCVMLDYAINSGIRRPAAVARALLSQGTGNRMTDGLVAAIQAKDPKWFIEHMNAERLHFMHQIRNGTAWDEFGHGWGARVADLTAYAEHLLTGAPAPAPVSIPPAPKAQHGDPQAHHKITAPVTSGSGILAGLAGFLHSGVSVETGALIVGAAALGGCAAGLFVMIKENSVRAKNDIVELPHV